MSVPIVRLTLALLSALVLAVACGDAGALDSGAEKELEAARDLAEQAQGDANAALRRVGELEREMAGLDDHLAASGKARKKLRARLERLGDGLRDSLEKLRTALEDARSGAGSAQASADEALARAGQIARDLAVLEQRYNYHLRRYHGGDR